MTRLDVLRQQENTLKEVFPNDDFFLWAAKDTKLHGDMKTIHDLENHVYPMMQNFRNAVQAGGAMGL